MVPAPEVDWRDAALTADATLGQTVEGGSRPYPVGAEDRSITSSRWSRTRDRRRGRTALDEPVAAGSAKFRLGVCTNHP
jgi:hypothetical protein